MPVWDRFATGRSAASGASSAATTAEPGGPPGTCLPGPGRCGRGLRLLAAASLVALAGALPPATAEAQSVLRPATGVPTISGTRLVGETLTASTSGIADPNGLTNPGWRYQWVRINAIGHTGETTDITGATSATYRLTADDVGKALRVEVRFRDDDGYEEWRVSPAFARNQGVLPAHCSLSDPAEIWCATMTVAAGMDTNFGPATGYDSRYTLDLYPENDSPPRETSIPSGTDDRLTPRRFIYNGKQFNVHSLAYNNAGALHWIAKRADGVAGEIGYGRFQLKLKRGSQETTLEYNHPDTRGRHWTDHGVSWSAGDTVEVKFVRVGPATRPRIPTLSSDAALSALALSEGTLSPAFTPAQTRYVARVQPATSRITVTPASHADATIAWLDAQDAALADADPGTTGFQVDLASGTGPRVIKMRVTAASGHTRTYEVTVSRNASGCGAAVAGELWCAVMTVAKKPNASGVVGYGDFGIAGSIAGIAPHGSLSQTTFVHRGVTARVSEVVYQIKDNRLRFRASIPNNGGPRGGFFGDDNYVLEVGTGADKRNFGIQSPGAGTGFSFDVVGLTWSVGDRVLVRLKSEQATTIAPPVAPWPPVIGSVGGLGADGWSRGEGVVVALSFDKDVYVSRGDGRNPPSIGIELGGVPGNARRAQYTGGSGTAQLTFLYQMQPGDGTHHAMRVIPDSLAQNGGVIMGLASPNPAALLGHAEAFRAMPTLPCGSYDNEIWCATLTVSSFTVGGQSALGFSAAGGGQGSLSNTQVSYGGATYPIAGLSYIPPTVGMALAFGQDGAASVFDKAGFTLHLGNLAYPFPSDSIDSTGKTVVWSFAPPPGWSAGDELFARLTGPPATSGQVEVAPPPVVEGAPAIGGTGTWSEGDDVAVTVTFSEAVAVDTAGGTPGIGVQLGASPANPRSAVYASGSGTAELVFRYTLAAGDGAHSGMAVTGDSLALNGGTIRSVETGTDATLAHNGAVVVRIAGRGTGPEVSFPGLPENHDGQSGFEVRVRFSGAPSGLSAQRDAASVLEVEGGTETGATAETKAADSPWAVTVAPDGGGAVTMRVPVRDCAAPGAVCIGGQKLARAAEATVPGPQISACPAPELTGGAELVWTGQLGLAKWPGKEYYGFGNGVRGTLDDRAFTLGSNDYLVDHVTQRGGSAGLLLFSLESRLSADEKRTLTLHACEDGKQLRFSDASGPSFWNTYKWRRTGGLDWTGQTGRTLYLSRDAAAPTLTAATVAGTSLALAFSETLAAASGLDASAFTVTADGDAVAVSSVQVDAGTVTLTLASPVSAGAAVTVSYARPAGAGNRLRDRFGNLVANLTDRIVDSGTAAPALPAVSIAAASTPVTEGTAASFTLTRTGPAAAALTVRVSVSETGAMASGTPPTEVAFAAGSASATLSVATEDDEAVESASTVTAALTADAGYTVDGSSGSAEVAVEDDDAAPAVTTATTIEVAENATAVASLAATDEDTPVGNLAWSIPEGEAGGADAAAFEVTAEGVLTFGSAKDFEAPDDADADGEYQVTVRVTDGANPVDAALVVRLADTDEAAPALSRVTVDGAALALGFGEALDEASSPAASAFEVTVGTDTRAVEAVALAGDTVTLTLASAVTAGETVTVSYTAPDEPDPGLRDASGNRVAGFADAAVTNGTAAVLAAVSIAPASTPVTEGTAASFTLTRTGPAAAALDGVGSR